MKACRIEGNAVCAEAALFSERRDSTAAGDLVIL
jgi:hypothetical protein